MEKGGTRREDRRTIYTKNVIKDSMLELLAEIPFEKITVAALCRQAEIVRTTFYLHYDGLTDVVKELADDAISMAEDTGATSLDGIPVLAQLLRETSDIETLSSNMSMLPVCQRVADDLKYRVMFRDPMVSEYIRMQIFRSQKASVVEDFQARLGITAQQAEKLFLFTVTGAFEVNKSMGWEKDRDWYEVQRVLLAFLAGGYEALER